MLFNYGEDYYHYSYKYDTRGNITQIYEDDILIEEYEYDEAGQLTAVHKVEADEAFVYTYDVNGNIISKTEYENVTNKNITTGSVVSSDTYAYTDTLWSDKLTAFNGQAITYDLMGNPLSYRGATLTWNGRLLMSYEKDGIKYVYTYNADNLRTSKAKYVNNTLVNKESYIWSGDVLIATQKYDCVTATSDVIRYLYDSNGEAYGFTYNGETYLYVKNLQGDVIGIISAEDNLLCLGLTYDPWGNVTYQTDEEADEYELQIANEIAAINNIAYRGYFYDSETGLYYLQSRYYDPQVGRFINADDIEILKDTHGIIKGANLFHYCGNNPLNYSDYSGNWNISNHKKLCAELSLEKSFREKIVFFNQECDKKFSSTNDISYPFHSRKDAGFKNSVKLLFDWAKRISITNKTHWFKYSELFSANGFTSQDKKANWVWNTSKAKEANNKILKYINNNSFDVKSQIAVLLGFALHILQDYYAHQIKAKCTVISSNYFAITDIDKKLNKLYGKKVPLCSIEDNTNIFKWRFNLAKKTSNDFIKLFNQKKNIIVAIKEKKGVTYTYKKYTSLTKKFVITTYYQEIYFKF